MERDMNYACYCLVSEKGTTYVGFSTNVDRRLRQHNCELSGGAKATKGHTWKRICTVAGFPTQQSALQFEWKWKNLSRKVKGGTAVERRCHALTELLNSEQSTSNAQPFSQYDGPLSVLIEDTCMEKLRDKAFRYGVIVE
jgi:predicted GIY-YIG superfamily endonuclease